VATVVVCSGGLDSVTLSHKIANEQTLIHLVSFDYGQRHRNELEYARRCAARLIATHDVIDITGVGRHLTGSALTDKPQVPDGYYAEDTMRLTVVPNRNAIMLTIAFGVATARGADSVAAAMHGGDHFIYADCRPQFVDAFCGHAATGSRRYCAHRLANAFSSLEQSRNRPGGRATWRAFRGDMVLLQRRGAALRSLRHLRRAAGSL